MIGEQFKHTGNRLTLADPPTVHYFAISILSSRTFWINMVALFVDVCSATAVVVLVPLKYMPVYSAVLAVINIVMRTQTTRPVALIAPGTVKPVAVERLGSPPIPLVTD
jgi:hypothetical protein